MLVHILSSLSESSTMPLTNTSTLHSSLSSPSTLSTVPTTTPHHSRWLLQPMVYSLPIPQDLLRGAQHKNTVGIRMLAILNSATYLDDTPPTVLLRPRWRHGEQWRVEITIMPLQSQVTYYTRGIQQRKCNQEQMAAWRSHQGANLGDTGYNPGRQKVGQVRVGG